MKTTNVQKIIWLEAIKAFALLWIFFNHVSEQLFGFPLISNPALDWPTYSNRVNQLIPLNGFGVWNIPVNILRYVGWFGDQGVQLFIIASGFGLTWGLLRRQAGQPLQVFPFYIKRAERIFPLWWGAHLLFIGLWLVTGWGLSAFEPATWLSFLGLRLTPGLLYYFSPAWWYFWLIVQLYLVYPLLWNGLRKWGPFRLLLWSSVAAFLLRGAGMFYFDSYLDAWSRGAFFITRLPEFVFGISLATWMFLYPEITQKRLSAWWVWILGIVAYLSGLYLALTLFGMIFSPFLLGVSAFMLLYLVLNRLLPHSPHWLQASSDWLGEHSYSLYLVHHPVILALIPYGAILSLGTIGRIGIAFVLMIVLALALEWVVNIAMTSLSSLWRRYGIARLVIVMGLSGLVLILALVGAEFLVRRFDPQEVRGWGERIALEPDPQLGWKLIPSQTTRLRWLSYDYMVAANSLGFPGPEYSPQKPEDVFRILVTGDAFSSAEGVNTDQAWPRLLEAQLNKEFPGEKVEILNFAMTGYGPNQYAEVVKAYASIYQPDLILVEVFVNDFQDVLWANEDFQNNIGFYSGNPNGITSIMKLEHLRAWIDLNVKQKLRESLKNEPNTSGYFLGNFSVLERQELESINFASKRVYEDLKRIQDVADQNNAKVMLVMAPAPVQVCSPDELEYYPHYIDLTDETRFDLDQPQRVMSGVAQTLGVPMYDLRDALSSSEQCLYQPRNMHWLVDGHRAVADYLAAILMDTAAIR